MSNLRKFSRRPAPKQTSLSPIVLEHLEERTLLSAATPAAPIAVDFSVPAIFAVGGAALTDVPVIGPVGAPTAPTPINPVTCPVTPIGVTIHAVAGVPFAGDVGLLKGLPPYAFASTNSATIGPVSTSLWRPLAATINWGDNTPVTQGTVVFDTLGIVQVIGKHTYAVAGTFPVTVDVTANPPPGSLAPVQLYVIHSTADVTQNSQGGVTITPTVNVPFTGTVGTFVDASATPLSSGNTTPVTPVAGVFVATINWGDNQTSVGQVVADSTVPGQYDVIGTHTYTTVGTFGIVIQVTEQLPPPPVGPEPLAVAPDWIVLFTTIDSTAIVGPGTTTGSNA